MSDNYKAYLKELEEEQADKPYEAIKEEMFQQSRHAIELDNLQPQVHVWIDRGAVMSCEGAAHPNHRSFKIQRT